MARVWKHPFSTSVKTRLNSGREGVPNLADVGVRRTAATSPEKLLPYRKATLTDHVQEADFANCCHCSPRWEVPRESAAAGSQPTIEPEVGGSNPPPRYQIAKGLTARRRESFFSLLRGYLTAESRVERECVKVQGRMIVWSFWND